MDFETFHKKIEKNILLLSIFINDKDLIKIIKSCRLKPYSAFQKNFKFTTKLDNHWVDEFGSSIFIKKDNIEILLDDKTIKHTTSKTDLFYGNSIPIIIHNGKSALFIKYDKYCILSIFGKDEYLRTFILKSEPYQISSLMLGIGTIKKFLNFLDRPYVQELQLNDLGINNTDKCFIFPLQSKYDGAIKLLDMINKYKEESIIV